MPLRESRKMEACATTKSKIESNAFMTQNTFARRRRRCRSVSFLVSFLTTSSLFVLVNGFGVAPIPQAQRKSSPSTWTLQTISDDGETSNGETSNEESSVLPNKSLMELLMPMETCSVNQMSGTDLAYIGDVVFELYIRSRHVWPSKRTSDLQNIVVGIVRAEHQSHLVAQVNEKFDLNDKEKQILMRGRNAVTRSKNRRNPAAYQDSTSFEALVGYLYIEDQPRCCKLLNWLDSIVDEPA
jgi:ribonuclease-3 family protein